MCLESLDEFLSCVADLWGPCVQFLVCCREEALRESLELAVFVFQRARGVGQSWGASHDVGDHAVGSLGQVDVFEDEIGEPLGCRLDVDGVADAECGLDALDGVGDRLAVRPSPLECPGRSVILPRCDSRHGVVRSTLIFCLAAG